MSGSFAAVIVIPIVTLAGLGVLIGVVMWHSSRRPPAHGPSAEPSRPIAGGILHGDPRQLTPHWGAPPPADGEPVSSPAAGPPAAGPPAAGPPRDGR